MVPYYADDTVTLHLGDCLKVLAGLPDASVDAIVTDPPAGVSFMGRSWDSDRGGRDAWIRWLGDRMCEAYRVLKPGGHALVWALPRTSHWTAMALEDAGFQIRDCVLHVFGAGFPKSLDVSKAIDKAKRGDMVRAKLLHFAEARGVDGRWLEERGVASAASFADWTVGGHVPSDRNWQIVKVALGITADEEAAYERAVVGQRTSGATAGMQKLGPSGIKGGRYDVTTTATDDAARWEGWGTALKPGQEIWWLVRKPMTGTVAANVLEYGTGALNIGACRVGTETRTNNAGGVSSLQRVSRVEQGYRPTVTTSVGQASEVTGRWPTNVVFTHPPLVDDVGEVIGDACSDGCVRTSGNRKAGTYGLMGYMGADAAAMPAIEGDTGGASRYFPTFRYEAKAPASERPRLADGTAHVSVKPLSLMRWFTRLITPPGGLICDPFAGSGTTGEAAVIEGFRCLLIEQDAAHAELIRTRLSKPIQPTLGDIA
jgi:hypothetical protein